MASPLTPDGAASVVPRDPGECDGGGGRLGDSEPWLVWWYCGVRKKEKKEREREKEGERKEQEEERVVMRVKKKNTHRVTHWHHVFSKHHG